VLMFGRLFGERSYSVTLWLSTRLVLPNICRRCTSKLFLARIETCISIFICEGFPPLAQHQEDRHSIHPRLLLEIHIYSTALAVESGIESSSKVSATHCMSSRMQIPFLLPLSELSKHRYGYLVTASGNFPIPEEAGRSPFEYFGADISINY
jgi:hypothetical protein